MNANKEDYWTEVEHRVDGNCHMRTFQRMLPNGSTLLLVRSWAPNGGLSQSLVLVPPPSPFVFSTAAGGGVGGAGGGVGR